MPEIILPDGSKRNFPEPVTVAEVAVDIGPGLARAVLAARVNGQLVDTSHRITADAELTLLTGKSDEGLEIIRHSTAHLLAMAVKQLYPEAQVTIGPTVENGFYYDFSFHRPFTLDDLRAIEARMEVLATADLPITRSVLTREAAMDFFQGLGEHFKVQIIAAIPTGEPLSLYTQGDFTDLCRGPHVPTTGKLRAFKLMKVAGAYWRGDSNNEMLQRIYGTAWPDAKQLKDHLHRLEEAEKRDHRKLGRELDLFHTQEEAPGMVFWHPRGWQLYVTLQDYIRAKLRGRGYQEVHTPQLLDRSLWERSGHWEKFHAEMFTTASENREYAVKPMNCPAHIQIYNHHLHSYRDLPLRLAEFGSCHRNEPSGSLHGLLRVRHFVQDDAHIFCTQAQIESEVSHFIDLVFEVYRDFGFTDVRLALSTRPPKRVGEDTLWDQAEEALAQALNHKGLTWKLQPGEGAFYGPKIEFALADSLNRIWQLGTIQLDFSMPGRLGAYYIAEDNSKQTPVMLHRAILGSLERFIGILIEHFAGALPVWLAPRQAIVLTITERNNTYAGELARWLCEKGFRVEADLRNEKIGLKIREHTQQKVPYLLVVGDREAENRTLAVRTRRGEDQGVLSWEDFLAKLGSEVLSRAL
ncbi:MAG: threonine--tRNA ligase [Pseudomonadota bacterium]